MNIRVIGISHRTAPIDIREQVAFSGDDLNNALLNLKILDSNAQSVILSTCNRIEIYTTLDDASAVIQWLAHYHQVEATRIIPHLYSYNGTDATEHLMRVASGIDSMVLGEPQILGQLKEAFAHARLSHMIGFELEQAFQMAFACAKAVRTKTAVGHCPVSVAYSAITLGKAHMDLAKANTLIIGAGVTAKRLIKHLHNTTQSITVINRTYAKAKALAEQYGVQAEPIETLPSHLNRADLVISATSSPDVLVKLEMLETNKTRLLVDIASPRDIDPNIANLENTTLYSIDDIESVIQKNTQQRSQAAIFAKQIIDEHQIKLRERMASRAAAPYISTFRQQSEVIRDDELAKAMKILKKGGDPVMALEQLSYNLTNKLLHQPTVNLHQAGTAGDHDVLELAQKLFKIAEK